MRLREPETESAPGWLDAFIAEPALVELVLLGFVGICLYLLISRAARLVADARSRRCVHDYLLGVEQALAHDARGAAKRLRTVLDEDPENRSARLLYGLVLADLGEAAEAHQQHLELHLGFDESSRRNDLALARNLIAVGCPADAIEHAERGVSKAPTKVDGLELLFRAQLTAGAPEDAGRTGRQLLDVLPVGENRNRIRQDLADTFCLAGETRLKAGDVETAKRFLGDASAAEPECLGVHRLRARLAWREDGEKMLLAETGSVAQPSSQAEGLSMYPAALALSDELPKAGLALLAKLGSPAPYRCRRCAGSLNSLHRTCTHCGAEGSVVSAEPDLLARVDTPSHLIDAIEENDAHVARILDRIDSEDLSAGLELVDIGAPSVAQALRRAVRMADSDVYVRLLQQMGSEVLPELFLAYEEVKSRHERGLERGRVASLVGKIVQGYGHDAIPVFRKLLETEDPELRKILVDYFLGLEDPEAFDTVLEQFPPVEVIHRLNEAPQKVLLGFLQKLVAGSFLVEVVLPDPVFVRDEVLLDAVSEGVEPATLTGILERRGFSRSMTRSVIERLAEAKLQSTCHRLLDGFGPEALEHQIASFANLDVSVGVREQLANRFAREGAAVVPKLCDCFGTSSAPIDTALESVLVRIGAVDPLLTAYAQGGLLEKFAQRFGQRFVHRRCMIIRVLASIGTETAVAALVVLRDQEKDKDLELRIGRALHKLDTGAQDEA